MFLIRLIRFLASFSGIIILAAIYIALAINTDVELPLKDEINDIKDSLFDAKSELEDAKSEIEDIIEKIK